MIATYVQCTECGLLVNEERVSIGEDSAVCEICVATAERRANLRQELLASGDAVELKK